MALMKNHCGAHHTTSKILIHLLYLLNFGRSQSTVSFCDGKDLFVINEGDCQGGLSFGTRKPDCVCISGVYRSWTKSCELYDGFTHKFCAPLWDEDDKGYNVYGLKLITGVLNIYQDTIAVFGENSSDFMSWNAFGMGSNGKTSSDSFYAVNGFPVMLVKPKDKFVCVEPAVKTEKQICRYFASDNPGNWEQGEGVRVLLMENCKMEGYTMSELKEHQCYDIMDTNVAECQLSCENGKTIYLPGSLQSRKKKSTAENEEAENGESMVVGPSGINENSVGDASQPGALHQLISNANYFQHRKLNRFSRLRQVSQLAKPDISQVPPNRTFTLLDISKNIVRSFCPSDFVSDLFLDQALELFVVLHKGQDFRYIDDITQRDFQWIKEILLACRVERSSNRFRDEFLPANPDSTCGNDDLIGYYEITPQNATFRYELTRGDHHRQGKYHYVIDAIWHVIDLTHVLCYPKFAKSYRMFHVWEQASEKLFSRDIRNLWFSPQVDLIIYNTLMSNRALVDMINLERCTEAAYKYYESMPELVRPVAPRSYLKRRKRGATFPSERISVAWSVDLFCALSNEDLEYNC